MVEANADDGPLFWKRKPGSFTHVPAQVSSKALSAILVSQSWPEIPEIQGTCQLPADGSGPPPGFDFESKWFFTPGRAAEVLLNQETPAFYTSNSVRALRALRALIFESSWSGSLGELAEQINWDGSPKSLSVWLREAEAELEKSGIRAIDTGSRIGENRRARWTVFNALNALNAPDPSLIDGFVYT